MGSIRFYNGQVLFDSGNVAMNRDCCCPGSISCACDHTNLYATARVKVEVSGFLASYKFGAIGGDDGADICCDHSGPIGFEITGLDSLNGTYYHDLTVDSVGCIELTNSATLASTTEVIYWEKFNSETCTIFDLDTVNYVVNLRITSPPSKAYSINVASASFPFNPAPCTGPGGFGCVPLHGQVDPLEVDCLQFPNTSSLSQSSIIDAITHADEYSSACGYNFHTGTDSDLSTVEIKATVQVTYR